VNEARKAWRTTVAASAVALVLGLPVIWMALSAILPRAALLDRDAGIVPDLGGADPSVFTTAATDPDFQAWLVNSIYITVVATVIGLIVSLPAGYSLSRFKVRGQGLLGLSLLVSLTLPGTLLVLPLFMLFTSYGVLNSRFAVGLVVAMTVVPFSSWMMKTFFDSIPRSLEEAAALDGCTRTSAFFRIILPLSKPAVAAVVAYSAIWSWSEFLFTKTLLTEQDKWPVTVGIVSFIGEHTTDWGAFMATGLLSALPLMLLFVLLEPLLVSGLASGGVKE
jgi:multiple sugar transport system permease protein